MPEPAGLPAVGDILAKMDGPEAAPAVETAPESGAAEAKPVTSEQSPAAASEQGGGQAEQPSRTPQTIPYQRFQAEIRKRQELEKRVAEYDKKKEYYGTLEDMDKNLARIYQERPEDFKKAFGLLTGQAQDTADQLKAASAEANAQVEATGQVDPQLAKEIAALRGQYQLIATEIQNQKQAVQTQEQVKEYEKQIDEFFSDAANARFKDAKGQPNVKFMDAATRMAQADPNGDLLAAMKQLAEFNQLGQQQVKQALAENNSKRQGAAVERGGAPAGKANNPPPKFGTEAWTEHVAANYEGR